MGISRDFQRESSSQGGSDRLDRAIQAWRETETPQQQMGDATRRRVLAEVRSGRPTIALRPQTLLFVPARRLALGAALPALALSVLIASWLWSPAGTTPSADVTYVAVSKRAGEVVFVIANGGRPHRVSKSLRPNGVGAHEVFTVTEGQFRDRLDAEAPLVFYRID